MGRLGRAIVLAALAAALVAALTACGSSGDSGSSSEKKIYTNVQYGFELTYSDPLSPLTLTASGNEEYAIAFADKDGPVIDDEYANGVRVSVNELSTTIKAKDVPKLKDQLEPVLEKMVNDTSGGKLTSKVTSVEVNGTPGYTVDYQFTQGGKQLTCRLTILIKGKIEYDLTEQTVAGDWNSMKSTLDQVVQSFRTL